MSKYHTSSKIWIGLRSSKSVKRPGGAASRRYNQIQQATSTPHPTVIRVTQSGSGSSISSEYPVTSAAPYVSPNSSASAKRQSRAKGGARAVRAQDVTLQGPRA